MIKQGDQNMSPKKCVFHMGKEKTMAILTSKCDRGFRIANNKITDFTSQKNNAKLKKKNEITIAKISSKITVKDGTNKQS